MATRLRYLLINNIGSFAWAYIKSLFFIGVGCLFWSHASAEIKYCNAEPAFAEHEPNCSNGDTVAWTGNRSYEGLFIWMYCNLEHQIISLDIGTDHNLKEVVCVYQNKNPEKNN